MPGAWEMGKAGMEGAVEVCMGMCPFSAPRCAQWSSTDLEGSAISFQKATSVSPSSSLLRALGRG